jgi:hypothetical protein
VNDTSLPNPGRAARGAARLSIALLVAIVALAGGACNRCTSMEPAATDCVAASRNMPFKFESGNYWGQEMTILREQRDMQACAKACQEKPDCKIATFVDGTVGSDYANTCVLRNTIGDRHPEETGICSWVKP